MQTTRPEKELLAMTESQPATPTASGSTAITRFNALRHGVLSRYTVLPWEDWEEYQVLLTALVAEQSIGRCDIREPGRFGPCPDERHRPLAARATEHI
jgi:hypothetical protein